MNTTQEKSMNAVASVAVAENGFRAERMLREDLAACFRLIAHFGWDDLIFNHISVRVPGPEHHFLINPYGFTFDEICASDLIKVDRDGRAVDATPNEIPMAGFVIHSAVHMAREDARCVIHLHTDDGVAVSVIEDGLLPLNQTAMVVAKDTAFHEFEGPALSLDERKRLQADLGQKNLMILRNHGTLAVGRSTAEAFTRMYFLERACTYQVRALSMGRPIHEASPESREITANLAREMTADYYDTKIWPAMKRLLDRTNPGYRT